MNGFCVNLLLFFIFSLCCVLSFSLVFYSFSTTPYDLQGVNTVVLDHNVLQELLILSYTIHISPTSSVVGVLLQQLFLLTDYSYSILSSYSIQVNTDV